MIDTRGLAAFLLAGLFCAGCNNKTQTTMNPPPPPEPNPQAQLAGDVRERIRELEARAKQYTANASRMPADDEQENRRLVAEQFSLLSQMIPMLSGPDMPGDLAQQLRIIESTRSQLANGSMELAAEPTVGTGLRSAQRALATINRQSFSEVPEIAKSVDAMAASVNELDTVSGPQHRWVASQAFAHSAAAINKMAQTMNQRLGNQTNRPAQSPTPPPATSDEKGPRAT